MRVVIISNGFIDFLKTVGITRFTSESLKLSISVSVSLFLYFFIKLLINKPNILATFSMVNDT